VLLGLALAGFLTIKLLPARSRPPIEIRSEGRDQLLARSVLAAGLERLFPKGRGGWQLLPRSFPDPGARCVPRSAAYRSSTGRAVTAAYQFAGWLEVRLESFVYVDGAAARRASSAPTPPREDECLGRVVAEGLRRQGYLVGEPRVFPDAHTGEDGRSSRIEIPTRYKARRYEWELDYTSVRRGRILLVLGTLTARSFEHANQALARELAPGAL
jgi:hypothetical protein